MSDELGYQVKEKNIMVRARVKWVCESCDETNLEIPFWCVWDEDLQEFIIGECTEDDAYCNQCEERTSYREEPI